MADFFSEEEEEEDVDESLTGALVGGALGTVAGGALGAAAEKSMDANASKIAADAKAVGAQTVANDVKGIESALSDKSPTYSDKIGLTKPELSPQAS